MHPNIMHSNGNPVEQDILAWRKQEAEIGQVFSEALVNSRAFLLEKLRQLDNIYYRHAGMSGKDESLTLRLLHLERKQLEKQLFPNFLDRMFHRLRINAKEMVVVRQRDQQRSDHELLLRNTLIQAGFGNINWLQFTQLAHRGESSFSIHQAQSNSLGSKLEFELIFSRDQRGLYNFDKYTAALAPAKKTDQVRVHTFSTESGGMVGAT